MLCEAFSLCSVRFLVCVMCFFLACVMCCSHAYDTSLRSVRALRARCGPFLPAAGPPGPLRALRARRALCLAACRCPATRLVLATCLPGGYLFTRLQPGCFEWPVFGRNAIEFMGLLGLRKSHVFRLSMCHVFNLMIWLLMFFLVFRSQGSTGTVM